MATGAVTRNANGIANKAMGKATGDGTALSVTLGFKPMSVKLVNLTDSIVWEKIGDMTDAQSVKTTGVPAVTVDTTSAITLTEKGFIVSAAAAANAKSLVWVAS